MSVAGSGKDAKAEPSAAASQTAEVGTDVAGPEVHKQQPQQPVDDNGAAQFQDKSCPECTFLNTYNATVCEVCGQSLAGAAVS